MPAAAIAQVVAALKVAAVVNLEAVEKPMVAAVSLMVAEEMKLVQESAAAAAAAVLDAVLAAAAAAGVASLGTATRCSSRSAASAGSLMLQVHAGPLSCVQTAASRPCMKYAIRPVIS